jgi:hypothetical protein
MILPTGYKISTEYDGKPRRVWPKVCEQCNEVFYAPRHTLEKRRYCSEKCRGLSDRDRVDVECAFCHKQFSRTIGRITLPKSGLNFCSRKCKDAAQSIDFGFLHYDHYKDGKNCYRDRALRYIKQCQKCGYSKDLRMIDVHHKNGNRDDGSWKNLEVLCVWCHTLNTRKVEPHNWNGVVAQSGEHLHGMQEVVGSYPIDSTMDFQI